MMQAPLDFSASPRGMVRAAAAAEAREPGWVERALKVVRTAALMSSTPFTIEQLRAQWSACLPPPPDLRAWGAVTQMAARRGYIAKTGAYAAADSSNGSPKPLYVKGPAA